jgi:hypothetical protein
LLFRWATVVPHTYIHTCICRNNNNKH